MDVLIGQYMRGLATLVPALIITWCVYRNSIARNTSFLNELKDWQTLAGAVIAITMFLLTQNFSEIESRKQQNKELAAKSLERFDEIHDYISNQIYVLEAARDYIVSNVKQKNLSVHNYNEELWQKYQEAKKKIPNKMPVDLFMEVGIGSKCSNWEKLITLASSSYSITNNIALIDSWSSAKVVFSLDGTTKAIHEKSFLKKITFNILNEKGYTEKLLDNTENVLNSWVAIKDRAHLWKARLVGLSNSISNNMDCPKLNDVPVIPGKFWMREDGITSEIAEKLIEGAERGLHRISE